MKTNKVKYSPKQSKSASKKFRAGDFVMAIAGNSKGQSGKILSVDGEKIVVQGLNIRKKHVKRTQEMQQGGIIEIEKPIHVSNLQVCTSEDKPLKLKVKTTENGERVLYYKDGDSEVTYRSLKKCNP